MNPLDLLWIFFILSSLQPVVQQRILAAQRVRALRQLEKRDRSRGITLIHRRDGFSFLGIPFGGFIDIDDSEAVIRAIEMTDPTLPISLVIHTPGGLVLAAEQIAAALAAHPAPVKVYVPHYAMSGGTLIALAADAIVMSPSAVLGPVDPQIGEYPAASVLVAVGQKDKNEIDDKTLILADVGRKAQQQVQTFVERLLKPHLDGNAPDVARMLSEGRWTHDFPIDVEYARTLGLPVSTDLPDEVRLLMRLYPQARNRRPSVEYIPTPYGGSGNRAPEPSVPSRQPTGPSKS
ncbi:MAG: ATP-dependent Clp protease proteolytic subunit [Actinobacteria bacterium]|nr:ATP-dependent Clp protease proteolytic subunit [Actinomycetota bacterium]